MLHFAAMSGNLEMIEWLAGKDPSLLDSVSQEGRTPLHTACGLGNLVLDRMLLKFAPELLSIKDNDNWSVIHFAVCSKVSKLFEWLFREDETLVKTLTSLDQTPLHLVCDFGLSDIAKSIVTFHPKQLRKADSKKRNALHFAAT